MCLFSACGLIIKENFFGNYFLTAPDTEEQLALSYHDINDKDNYPTLIEETVFAVGYNETYIIVQQHPGRNKRVTNFYILPIKKGMDWKTKNGLIGPMTLEQFNEKRRTLNIPNELKFTIEKEDLK